MRTVGSQQIAGVHLVGRVHAGDGGCDAIALTVEPGEPVAVSDIGSGPTARGFQEDLLDGELRADARGGRAVGRGI